MQDKYKNHLTTDAKVLIINSKKAQLIETLLAFNVFTHNGNSLIWKKLSFIRGRVSFLVSFRICLSGVLRWAKNKTNRWLIFLVVPGDLFSRVIKSIQQTFRLTNDCFF